MNVTAFVRQTATAKKKATIYIRVRDNDTKTDIKAATELSINPAYWDADRQGYKSRVTMVRDEERRTLNDAVHDLCRTVSQEYFKGATSDWLKKTIFCFHHPNAYKLTQATVQETRLSKLVEEYISHKDFDKRQATAVRGLVGKIERFERFQRNVRKKKDYTLHVDNFTVDDLEAFQRYLIHENEYYHQYPQLYLGMDKWTAGTKRSDNTLHTVFTRLRTVVRWCIHQGITKNNPFDVFEIPKAIFGTPFFLTIEERDRIWSHDFSDSPHLAMFRDMFVFQCFIGCRFGDLMRLTNGSVIDGVLEYIAHKTMKHDARTIRVPLSKTAMTIYERYRGVPTKSLFPHYNVSDYNKGIREVLRTVGINRIVSVLDPVTRQNVQKPLHEVATSHTARKTFIGNLYKQVKDPSLISSMSGHTNGSQAFARYRTIDDEMKRELIGMLD